MLYVILFLFSKIFDKEDNRYYETICTKALLKIISVIKHIKIV